MLRNYLKIALRQLSKNKSYVIINTMGMGVALACCICAYLLVAFNIEFDDYFNKDETRNITKIISHYEDQNGEHYQNLMTPMVLPPFAVEDIAGIERYTRFTNENGYLSFEDKSFSEHISFADSTFFDMFTFQLKSGSVENFRSQKSIFLSEDLAVKYFADEDPVGKLVVLEFRNKQYEAIVGGVIKKYPSNTSFNIQALMRVEIYLDVYDIGPDKWGEWRDASVLMELNDPDNAPEISEQFKKYVPIRNEAKKDAVVTSYELVPFDAALDDEESGWSQLMSRISFVPMLVFISLASMILLIACFNLTNTTIALTAKRLKEIGVRKVVGARRIQVVTQFLLEMVLTITLAIVVGLGISQIIVPKFTAMWGLPYAMSDMSGINLFAALVILMFISALLAGAYPALYNSRFNPISLLKGKTRKKGTNMLTRALLVIQFSISVIVLVAGIIFTMNANYQKKIDFGYDLNRVVTVTIQGPAEYNALRNAILSNKDIEAVAVTDHHIGYGSYDNPITIDTAELTTHVYEVGATYFDAIGLEILEGRNFIDNSQADFEEAAIVDENFVKHMNLESPIDTRVIHQGKTYRIVGVVKNHLNALFWDPGMEEGHFFKVAKPEQYHLLVARVNGDIEPTIDFIESKWKELFPGKPFESRTQQDIVFQNASETNRNLVQIFLFLTILGSLLSASGIYSLANLNIEKRTKEIGIRKTLGASISNIIRLINMEFVIILALAMLFGGVGGYLLTDSLLDEIYIKRIPISVFAVILCSLTIFIIGIGTTSGTILKAAHSNPVDTLRDE